MSREGGFMGIYKISDKRTMFKAKIITAIHYGISFHLVFCPNIPMGCNTLISVIVVSFSAPPIHTLSEYLRVGW